MTNSTSQPTLPVAVTVDKWEVDKRGTSVLPGQALSPGGRKRNGWHSNTQFLL